MDGLDGLMDLMPIGSRLLIRSASRESVHRPMISFAIWWRTMASVRNTPSMDMFSLVRCGDRPRWRTISFMACVIGSAEVVKSSMLRLPLFEVPL